MNTGAIITRWLRQPLRLCDVACGSLLWYCHPDGCPIYADMLCSTILITLSLWIVQLVVNQYPTRVGAKVFGLLTAVVVGILVWLLDIIVLQRVFQNNPLFLSWLHSGYAARLILVLLCNTFIALLTAQHKQRAALEDTLSRSEEASTLLRQATLYKLRQQLQPHFLYNSLNSISALIILQPDKAQEMTGKLASFLRATVKGADGDQVPVSDELSYIEDYLSIETIRFGDRLQVQIEKDDLDDAMLPPLLLQPILENAIRFGLYGKTGQVTITLTFVLQSGFLIITVINPYDPDMRPASGTGFGLAGIRQRLLLLYSRADLLETIAGTANFTTIIKIPQPENANRNHN